jgi:hypothetical protein
MRVLSAKDLLIVDLKGRINSLEILGKRFEAALRDIAAEVSAIGCEGPFDDVCHEYTAPKEDWCPWCRIGATINAVRSPASGGTE